MRTKENPYVKLLSDLVHRENAQHLWEIVGEETLKRAIIYEEKHGNSPIDEERLSIIDEMTGGYIGKVVKNYRQATNNALKNVIGGQHATTSRYSADYNQIERDALHKRNMKADNFVAQQGNPNTALGKRCLGIKKISQSPNFHKEFRDAIRPGGV